jgi:hypothetical protein
MSSQIPKKQPISLKPKVPTPKKPEEDSALLTLLKKYNLQSYYKILADKGFDQNLKSLVYQSESETQALLDSIKFFPGHRSKFEGILNLLKKLQVKDTPKVRSSSTRSSSKEKGRRPSSKAKVSTPRGSFRKMLDFQEPFSKSNSESDRSNLIAELEEANRKIRELTLQLECNSPSPKKQESFDPFEEFPEVSKEQQELGVSYDSAKMRSTLHYLDIEEICKCLSKVLRVMILNEDEQLAELGLAAPGAIIPLGIKEMFNVKFTDPHSKLGVFPAEEEIYNITKNIIIRSKMEKECSIICLIYIERLRSLTSIRPTERNWKRLIFITLVLSSKVWDDESYENINFSDVFSNISLSEINSLESTFLSLIDFQVGITKSEYAKFYFLLRTFTDRKSRSFPIVPLDVDTVRKLQGSSNGAEAKLREVHDENLLKTL